MIELLRGDCVEVLQDRRREMRNTVDLCVTDGPYHIESIAKRFGNAECAPAGFGRDGMFARSSERFIGAQWDTNICFQVDTWKAILNVLKPGAFCFAFASATTGHRQACAMEDAGFVMYPFFAWAYSTGAPKPHPVGDGSFYGRAALRTGMEPIYCGQKPISEKSFKANVERWGTGALQIENYKRSAIANKWPTNIIIDGSPELDALFPVPSTFIRLHHVKKATKEDRGESEHPTAKPVDLLQRLVALGAIPGSVVLDPFAGSGTTGVAARRQDCSAILIERDRAFFDALTRRFERRGRDPLGG
jgi:DNA modification methylase